MTQDPREDRDFLNFLFSTGLDPATMSPEEVQAVYADYAGQRSTIDKQRDQSTAMRKMSSAGLGGTQVEGGGAASSLFVADSPWEAVGAIGGAAMDKYKQGQADKAEGALSEQEAVGAMARDKAMASALRGGGGGAPQGGPGGQVLTPAQIEEDRRRKMGQYRT